MTDERKPETSGLAEVSPKFVDEAEAAVEAAASTDTALADLERLAEQRIIGAPEVEDPVLALKREWDVRRERYKNESNRSDEETIGPLQDRLIETEFAIYRTLATTPEGIAIKLRLWGRNHPDPDRGENWCEPPVKDIEGNLDDMPILSVLRDLEHMSQEIVAEASQAAAKPEPSGDDAVPAADVLTTAAAPLIRAKTSDLEQAVSNLEGASNALNNFAQTDDLPTEVDIGLQWLAYQIDAGMVDLREQCDKLHGDAGGSEA